MFLSNSTWFLSRSDYFYFLQPFALVKEEKHLDCVLNISIVIGLRLVWESKGKQLGRCNFVANFNLLLSVSVKKGLNQKKNVVMTRIVPMGWYVLEPLKDVVGRFGLACPEKGKYFLQKYISHAVL